MEGVKINVEEIGKKTREVLSRFQEIEFAYFSSYLDYRETSDWLDKKFLAKVCEGRCLTGSHYKRLNIYRI